jgi:hypothetical protein
MVKNRILWAVLGLSSAIIFAVLAFHRPQSSIVYAQALTDPCAQPNTAKSSAFKNITTGTTTALVAVSGSTNIYVCALSMDISSTSASTVIFENGTGVACATSPTALTHTFTNSTLVNAYKQWGGGLMTLFSTGASQGLCALTTIGTAPTIGITVTYVQQ